MRNFADSMKAVSNGRMDYDSASQWVKGRINDPLLTVIAQPGACWCGEDLGHEWPGKHTGSPHPRGSG